MSRVTKIDRDVPAFVSNTQHLTVEEFGAYQILCDQIVILGQNNTPPSLSDDDVFLSRLLRLSPSKWKAIKARLCEGPYAVLTRANGFITQIRLAAEIEIAKERVGEASKAGKLSAIARAKKRVREQIASNGTATVVEHPFERKPDSVSTSAQPLSNSNSISNKSISLDTERAEAQAAANSIDWGTVEALVEKIAAAGMKTTPSEQTIVAWYTEFGPELIVETLADCEAIKDKPWKYLESVLVNRLAHPEDRPGNRRAAALRPAAKIESQRPAYKVGVPEELRNLGRKTHA